MKNIHNVRRTTVSDARQISILRQRNRFGMIHVATRCAHGVSSTSGEKKKNDKMVDTPAATQCCIHTTPGSLQMIAKFDLQNCSTESSTPRIYEHNIGLPALSRPSSAHTLFVMTPALSPSVQISARLSLPDNVAQCQVCTHKKLPSTCMSPSKPWLRWRRYTVKRPDVVILL